MNNNTSTGGFIHICWLVSQLQKNNQFLQPSMRIFVSAIRGSSNQHVPILISHLGCVGLKGFGAWTMNMGATMTTFPDCPSKQTSEISAEVLSLNMTAVTCKFWGKILQIVSRWCFFLCGNKGGDGGDFKTGQLGSISDVLLVTY